MLEPSDTSKQFYVAFYRDPNPAIAAAALVDFCTHPPERTRHNVWLMFARAVQVYRPVRAAFTAVQHENPAIAAQVGEILAAADDPAFDTAAHQSWQAEHRRSILERLRCEQDTLPSSFQLPDE